MNWQIFLRALIALLSMQLDNKARYSIGLRYILQKMRGFQSNTNENQSRASNLDIVTEPRCLRGSQFRCNQFKPKLMCLIPTSPQCLTSLHRSCWDSWAMLLFRPLRGYVRVAAKLKTILSPRMIAWLTPSLRKRWQNRARKLSPILPTQYSKQDNRIRSEWQPYETHLRGY